MDLLGSNTGTQFSFVIFCFVSGGAELQEGGGLARAWTTCGPKVLSTNAPMKRRGRRGDSDHGTAILLRFAVIHTKIEANLLKSVAYKTLDIHVPLFNNFIVNYKDCCTINCVRCYSQRSISVRVFMRHTVGGVAQWSVVDCWSLTGELSLSCA